jgi:Ca2+-binding RTX toxin-like protein
MKVRRFLGVAVAVAMFGAAYIATSASAGVTCFGSPLTQEQGGPGNNWIEGTLGSDVIHAGAGNDHVKGLGGADKLCGGTGHDELRGAQGDDHLGGSFGKDVLIGGPDNDHLYGGRNDDNLGGGGPEQDFLFGGPHVDGDTCFLWGARERFHGCEEVIHPG